MKSNLLTALMILICGCGGNGEVEPTYFDSHFLGATYYPDKPYWQLSDGTLDSGYHIESGLLYNFEVKDTIPRKTTGTNQPSLADSLKSKWSDASQGKFIPSFWVHGVGPYDSGYLSPHGFDSILPKIDSILIFEGTSSDWELSDTTRCILLVSDTSSHNGLRVFWMYGYVVEEYSMIPKPTYLDERKVPLSKNLVVWISKEIR